MQIRREAATKRMPPMPPQIGLGENRTNDIPREGVHVQRLVGRTGKDQPGPRVLFSEEEFAVFGS